MPYPSQKFIHIPALLNNPAATDIMLPITLYSIHEQTTNAPARRTYHYKTGRTKQNAAIPSVSLNDLPGT